MNAATLLKALQSLPVLYLCNPTLYKEEWIEGETLWINTVAEPHIPSNVEKVCVRINDTWRGEIAAGDKGMNEGVYATGEIQYCIDAFSEAQSNEGYCLPAQLKQVPERVKPYVCQDHLCFGSLTRTSGNLQI